MNILRIFSVATVLVLSTSANADLVGRLAATPGGTDYQAYYNDEANLTWLADANYAATQYANSRGAEGTANGVMAWDQAMAWAANLVVDGVGGWRLPNTVDVGNDGRTYTSVYQGVDFGYNITAASELSNMFYNVLGNTASLDINGVTTGCGFSAAGPDYCLTNTGPFSNIQVFNYWSGTEYAPNTKYVWQFNMLRGYQDSGGKGGAWINIFSWAVQTGDVSAVPVPAAVWLFGSGLVGLIAVARRKKA